VESLGSLALIEGGDQRAQLVAIRIFEGAFLAVGAIALLAGLRSPRRLSRCLVAVELSLQILGCSPSRAVNQSATEADSVPNRSRNGRIVRIEQGAPLRGAQFGVSETTSTAEDNMLVGPLSQRGRSAHVSEARYSENPGLRVVVSMRRLRR